MKLFYTRFMLLFTIPVLVLAGFRHQPEAKAPELVTLHQGNLRIPDHPDAPKLVYVDARDLESHAPHLRDHLAAALASGKFRLADSPSNAGYILHVQILKDGPVDPEALKATVGAGYGKKTSLKGGGSRALVVDALMVQRRIPRSKKPGTQKMKNISSRNALGSSQMRLAVLSPQNPGDAEKFSQAVARELALRMQFAD